MSWRRNGSIQQHITPFAHAGAQEILLGDAEGLPVASIALDKVFADWQREATITWPEWNARLAIVAQAPIDFLVVYTPLEADFFCVEPVSHCDAFNLAAEGRTDTGMLTLPPGGRLRTSVRLRPSALLTRRQAAQPRPYLR